MILRKPYAFIIKHFRLIHLIILGCLLFLLYNTLNINQLLTSLQKSNTLIYSGAYIYIDNIVYFFIGITSVLSGIVFWLLKEKKKPTKLYFFLLMYLIVISIGYIYIYSFLTTIQNEIVDIDKIVLCKDISFLLTIPMYAFVAFCFIRGIGFNIKQFNFSKDIKELQIVDQDSEEFELLIGQNNYKYLRTIRRTIREIKYYVLENKFAISCISLGILTIFMGIGIYYYNQYVKKLKENEVTSVNSISYIINKSYITSYDYNGNKVKEGYKFVVVDMKFYNSSLVNKKLDLDLITLADGKIVYYPTLLFNGKFYDLGVPYLDDQIIKPTSELEATLTFEIPEKVNTRNFTLRVQYDLEANLDKVIVQYKKFAVNTTKIDTEEITKTNELNKTINTNIIGKNPFALTIKGYKIMDSYNNRYIVCSDVLTCRPLSNVIRPTTLDKTTMLVIDYEGIMYEDAKFTKTFNSYNKVFENYVTVNYSINNREYSSQAKAVMQSDVDGKVFLAVDRNIHRSTEISLVLNFRNEKIIVPLKKKSA